MAQWLAYYFPNLAVLGSNHVTRNSFFRENYDVAVLVNSTLLIQWTVNSEKLNYVVQTHPLLANGKGSERQGQFILF